jgi:predicted alpha/beta-hydrolase family hydrolase
LYGRLGGSNFLFRSQYKIIEQQLLPAIRPSCRVSALRYVRDHLGLFEFLG